VMQTALARNDLTAARTAFFQMPQDAQNANTTRYLAFKLALRSCDEEFASECLDVLFKNSGKDQKYLYACVLEAQQSDSRTMAITAFQRMVEQPPKGTQLPALLRCTARLFIGELDRLKQRLDEVMAELLRVFETAANNVKVFRQGTEEQWRAEIQWWSKNAFNLSLRFCADAHPEHLIRLVKVCCKFLEHYPDDGGLMYHNELVNRKQLCHFLSATGLTILGRSHEERSEDSLQCYSEVRKEVSAYTALDQTPSDQTEEAAQLRLRLLERLS
jgi:hypothetical protein